MSGPTGRPTPPKTCQQGSILLLMLLFCLAVGVVVQGVCTLVVCAERGVIDETVGRQRLEERDKGLEALRQKALARWESSAWTRVWPGGGTAAAPGVVEGSLSALEGDAGWAMGATVRQGATVSGLITSAWVERGRDGVDLPLAALVAETVIAPPGRAASWLVMGEAEGLGSDEAVGYLLYAPKEPLVEEGCTLMDLREPWRLDQGWIAFQSQEGAGAQSAPHTGGGENPESASPAAVAPGPQVTIMESSSGSKVGLPEGIGSGTPEQPLLVIVAGGVDLDAEDLGDMYGVIVVDGGSLFLDGTTVHGALFVTEGIDMGDTGRLLFSRAILRWATDRSLQRARLVPGTRWEGME